MLNNVVRRFFRNLGVHDLTDEQCIGFIKVIGLDKLPVHYAVVLSTLMPVIEIIVAKLKNEQIDWGDLGELK